MTCPQAPVGAFDEAPTWEAIRGAARLARDDPPADGAPFRADPVTGLAPGGGAGEDALVVWHGARGWRAAAGVAEPARSMLDLYLPVCAASREASSVIAHLGQSVDGFIAGPSGDSYYVTGPENLTHLHRLRALADAVVVGAGTVATDDPRLTTRRVTGADPTRVVLDPRGRLAPTHRVFAEGPNPTLVASARGARPALPGLPDTARRLDIPCRDGALDLPALLDALRERGLSRIFVEGGGDTVSRFVEAGLVDRLHIAIAPLIIGTGRAGLRLAPAASLDESLRPAHRTFRLGEDLLFDFDLRARPRGEPPAGITQVG